ncbi:MAG: site-2 protease family protein [Advenella sp.]
MPNGQSVAVRDAAIMGDIIRAITIYAIPLIFAITLAEAARGFVAHKLGDRTALMLGRLTLNPAKHIDPIGTILVPLLLIAANPGFVVGWPKPIPVNESQFANPKRDSILLALARPLANLLMGILWVITARLLLGFGLLDSYWWKVAIAGFTLNIFLMVFNLLPIPPMDGSRIIAGFLPAKWAIAYQRLEPYGFFIVLGLIAFGLLQVVLLPVISVVLELLGRLFLFG